MSQHESGVVYQTTAGTQHTEPHLSVLVVILAGLQANPAAPPQYLPGMGAGAQSTVAPSWAAAVSAAAAAATATAALTLAAMPTWPGEHLSNPIVSLVMLAQTMCKLRCVRTRMCVEAPVLQRRSACAGHGWLPSGSAVRGSQVHKEAEEAGMVTEQISHT